MATQKSVTAANTLHKIDINLDGKNASRLAMKQYTRDFTNIPNTALPSTLKEELGVVYEFLTDTELPLNDYTFLVKARDGRFSRVFSPAVYVSKIDKHLVIKWGAEFIPVLIEEGELKLKSGKKCKLVFKQEKVSGYDNPVLTLSFSTKDKEMYLMSFPVRRVSLEDNIEAEELEMYLDNNDISSLLDQIQEQPDPSSSTQNEERDKYSTGEKLLGDIVKVSNLPVGEFPITAIRRYQNAYGIQHLVQTEISPESSFVTSVSFQDDGGNWQREEREIVGKVVLKANSKLNKLLLSDPIVSEENPATLVILEKGTFNGYDTARLELLCNEYTSDAELFDISF
jgi:hypothetical protein